MKRSSCHEEHNRDGALDLVSEMNIHIQHSTEEKRVVEEMHSSRSMFRVMLRPGPR